MGFRKRVMEIPWVYDSFQSSIRKPELEDWFASQVVSARPGDSVLDVGCGTAEIVNRLKDINYLGIDHNPSYIKQARDNFGGRARFECWDAGDSRIAEFGKFDVVIVSGLMHHLNDHEVRTMLTHISKVLKPDGRLVTSDCALDDGQHWIARLLVKLDRGRFARFPDGYRKLLAEFFDSIDATVRHDLLRIPYTNVIFTARSAKPAAASS